MSEIDSFNISALKRDVESMNERVDALYMQAEKALSYIKSLADLGDRNASAMKDICQIVLGLIERINALEMRVTALEETK